MWDKWGSPSIPFGGGDLHITHPELCDFRTEFLDTTINYCQTGFLVTLKTIKGLDEVMHKKMHNVFMSRWSSFHDLISGFEQDEVTVCYVWIETFLEGVTDSSTGLTIFKELVWFTYKVSGVMC